LIQGGDPVTFDAIVKAYKALTDDESRENWRLYGNPDGPKATTFGIALPKWIVSEKYGGWVLGLYTLVFMVLLPTAVVCKEIKNVFTRRFLGFMVV
jgi:translocation protein SEC63